MRRTHLRRALCAFRGHRRRDAHRRLRDRVAMSHRFVLELRPAAQEILEAADASTTAHGDAVVDDYQDQLKSNFAISHNTADVPRAVLLQRASWRASRASSSGHLDIAARVAQRQGKSSPPTVPCSRSS